MQQMKVIDVLLPQRRHSVAAGCKSGGRGHHPLRLPRIRRRRSLAVDPNFRANIQGALAAGLPVGAYWCTQALSDEEALEEAAFCREILKPFEITYPVYLDSEWMEKNAQGRADQISKQRRTRYALTWMREMKTYGYAAGLYTGESWFTDYIDGPAIAAEGFEIWLAKWSSVRPIHQHMGWQYTQSEKNPRGAHPG